ncbi:MAG: TerB family tellurite resistance protein [Rickettsiales bacterium]|nr:TerB family tellurite resistance protein [Rickettsiales bacterium]
MLPSLNKNISEFYIPQHHINSAIEANSLALNHYALAISGKLCSVDEDINLAEKRAFLALFPYFGGNGIELLNSLQNNGISIYHACKRFRKFSSDDKNITARLFARLFKLAGSDEVLNTLEISFMEKISPMLGLNLNFLEKALEFYFLKNLEHNSKTPKHEVRKFYIGQIAKLHPDNFLHSDNLSKRIKSTIITLANERTKLLNENYKNSIA